jgi:penicillin G amidase
MEIHYDSRYFIGASHPGVPYVMIGKSNDIAFAATSSLTDMSDLYKEQISADGTKYLVNGEWRDLMIEQSDIKVKGREDPIKFEVKYSHRGPIMTSTLLTEAEVLF